MKENCLDIGIIQAFLDSELSHDETARVSGHIALCDACALMLADAEDESAIVFPALEREFNTLVPTQRLWNKINDSLEIALSPRHRLCNNKNDSIQTEREALPFWHKAWAFLTISLRNPSMVAAASLLLVFGLFATLWINKNGVSTNDTSTPSTTAKVVTPPAVTTPAPTAVAPSTVTTTSAPAQPNATIERASYRPENRRVAVADKAPVAVNAYLPGEESYVKTISDLNKSVGDQKDSVLRPSERIAYERDMAVVNDTIKKMKTEVKRNPKNESAKQILYSSYQNKIDLLNSVARKEELVASLVD